MTAAPASIVKGATIVAMQKNGPMRAAPPNQIAFMYMLAGDNGASNTDPYATAQTSGNHWVKTGPHVMIPVK